MAFHIASVACRSSGVGQGYYSDIADFLGAMQLWPEHRYYATDPKNSPPDDTYEHLSIEQALVDHVELVLHIQRVYGLDRNPVIAIGSSYSESSRNITPACHACPSSVHAFSGVQCVKRQAGQGCAVLGWAGLGWAGLGWAALGWAGLGASVLWAGLG